MNAGPIVVKIGGGATLDVEAACRGVARLLGDGRRVVLVHGGGRVADELARRLHRPPRLLTSAGGVTSRYTDADALWLLTMALRGSVAPRIVATLQRFGVRAVGLGGYDGRLVVARRKAALKASLDGVFQVVRDDLSGRIEAVDASLLGSLLALGVVPVLSPPAAAVEGGMLNVDADRLAAAVAVACGADRLILLTDVPGLLRDPRDHATLVDALTLDELRAGPGWGTGRMKLKLVAAREALEGGVAEVVLADGRASDPVRAGLDGVGTTITVRPRERTP